MENKLLRNQPNQSGHKIGLALVSINRAYLSNTIRLPAFLEFPCTALGSPPLRGSPVYLGRFLPLICEPLYSSQPYHIPFSREKKFRYLFAKVLLLVYRTRKLSLCIPIFPLVYRYRKNFLSCP